jgi:uncharacterized protein
VRLKIHDSISSIPRPAWDALLDERANPFVSHALLAAFESSGCAAADTGWRPAHLTLWEGDALVAAAPAWLRDDSDGDFGRDWGWASGAARARIPYYPKLILSVPFSPVTGRRLLVAPGRERLPAVRALVEGARALAEKSGASSVHVLFALPDEAEELAACGLAHRLDFQYHWNNRGYHTPDDYLARFNSKRRNQLKRERAAPAQQGITIRTVRADEIARDPERWADTAFELHRSTVEKLMWGRGWLNREFYRAIFAGMPGPLELVTATRDGRLVAGAFNVATPTHLYGRYWGCHEDHPFLHFNVCLYHSIDECIARGVQVFEGGAGGDHKLVRGFEPAFTHSAHLFLDPRLDLAIRNAILAESAERKRALAQWESNAPILKR